MIELRKLTFDNWKEVAALKVAENQSEFIEFSTLHSIAETYIYNTNGEPATAYGIYADDTPVGYFRYSYWIWEDGAEDDPYINKYVYCIDVVMIDEHHQGKGYGRQAFEKLLADISKMPYGEAEYIIISYSIKNVAAKSLYASFGFVESLPREDCNGMYAHKCLK